MQYGFGARKDKYYCDEVKLAQENGFDFIQIWYDNKGISIKDTQDKEKILKEFGYPFIIHAVLDINEIQSFTQILIEKLCYFEHRELILHPVCRSEEITAKTIYKLSEIINEFSYGLSAKDISLYIENNSKKNPIFTSVQEIEYMFSQNRELKFLLDIAHIDDYAHLESMVKTKMPEILHIADRHLEVVHEHLPLGNGNINFKYIFTNILNCFKGRIVFEVESDSGLNSSKIFLEELFKSI